MKKQELINRLSEITRKYLGSNGYCYRICGVLEYNGKPCYVFSSAFSELEGERGKLFFRICESVYPKDEWDILAEDMDESTLQGFIDATEKILSYN